MGKAAVVLGLLLVMILLTPSNKTTKKANVLVFKRKAWYKLNKETL